VTLAVGESEKVSLSEFKFFTDRVQQVLPSTLFLQHRPTFKYKHHQVTEIVVDNADAGQKRQMTLRNVLMNRGIYTI